MSAVTLDIGGSYGNFKKTFDGDSDRESIINTLTQIIAFPESFTTQEIREFASVDEDEELTRNNLRTLWNWSYEWDRNLRMNRKNAVYYVGKKKRSKDGTGNFKSLQANKKKEFKFIWDDWSKRIKGKHRVIYIFIGKLSRKQSLKWFLKWIEMDLSEIPSFLDSGYEVLVSDGDWADVEDNGLKNSFADKVKRMEILSPGHYLIAKSGWDQMFVQDGDGWVFSLEGEKEVFMRAAPKCFCASNEYMARKLKKTYYLWKLWRIIQEKCDFEVTLQQGS